MTLRSPILDDRSFAQLRDELLRMIPVYSKEWTDHNPSDPGVTLLELFAFLGENLLFRFNQIPETTRLAFLELLRIPVRPAEVARALLACATEDPAGRLVAAGTAAAAGKLSFETQQELMVWPLEARAFGRVAAPLPEDEELAHFASLTVDAAELGPDEAPVYYELRGVELGQPAEEIVDFGATVDGTLWTAVLALEPPLTHAARRDALAALAGQRLNLGVAFDERVTSADEVEPCPGAGATSRGPETVWDASAADLVAGRPRFVPLGLQGDSTRGLSTTGVVRLELPEDMTRVGVPAPPSPDLAGARDFPPELAPDLQERLLFWVRAYRRSAAPPLGRVQWVGANATEVVQTRSAGSELLGVGNGQPDQTFTLTQTPVRPDSLVIEVEEQRGRFEPYARVDGFWASGELDRHYVVDAQTGTVRFGRHRGRAPQIGERIRAARYRYGGGREGNVAPGAIGRLEGVRGVTCENPLWAHGGADAEPIADALDRIPGELRRRDRMVTASDTRELARMTPGADVARAEVLPTFDPVTGEERAGAITVVVWPARDLARPSAPMPSRTTLDAVCAWLDERRLVTTELWVVPPRYVPVAVSIGVEVKPGYGVDAVRAWVERVVRQYLAPLPPYGPEGEGWPLGRSVLGRELEAAVLQVEGVRFLAEDVRVATRTEDGWARADRDTVTLGPLEVPELAEISVVQGPPLEPGEAFSPVTRTDDGAPAVAVPIPVIEDEC